MPDESGQFTSDHGWALPNDNSRLHPIVVELKSLGVRVSLFMDPLSVAMPLARALGADRVELYTEPFAAAFDTDAQRRVLSQYVDAANAAQSSGLGINAGHDLNLKNLPAFVRAMPGLQEVSIGHALIADAIEFGLADTVRRYRAAANGVGV